MCDKKDMKGEIHILYSVKVISHTCNLNL